MATEKHWNRVVESGVNLDGNNEIITEITATEFVDTLLQNSNGALDFLGPTQCLLSDLSVLNEAEVSHKRNLLDSDLNTYTAKNDVIRRAGLADSAHGLAHTYEIIPSEWCDPVGKELSGSEEVSEVIDRYPLIFNKFSDCPSELLNFPPVIRLIHDGDDKFLFTEDVEKAICWVLRNKNRESEWKGGGTSSGSSAGVHLCTSYVEYLETLRSFRLEENEITLVNVNVCRTRLSTIPLPSPRGTSCIPVLDAFLLIVSILTPKNRPPLSEPRDLGVVLAWILKGFVLRGATNGRYFIDKESIQEITYALNADTGPKLTQAQVFDIPDRKFLWISTDRLKEELVKWRLDTHFPGILEVAASVSVRYQGLSGSRQYSPLDLYAAVQHCVVLCLSRNSVIHEFLHNQGYCNSLRSPACASQPRKARPTTRLSSVGLMTVQEENEFALKLYFCEKTDETSGILVDKTTGTEIVSNMISLSRIADKLIALIDGKYQHAVLEHVMANMFVVQCVEDLLLSGEEELILTEDVLQKLEKRNAKTLRTGRNLDKNEIVNELAHNFADCFTYAAEVACNLMTFQKYLPDRKVIFPVNRQFRVEYDEFEVTTHSVIFMQVLRMMLEKNSSNVSELHWAWFDQVMSHFRNNSSMTEYSSWQSIVVDGVFDILKHFPIDIGKFHFVPNVDTVFKHFTEKVSEIIEDVQNGSLENRLEGELEKLEAVNEKLSAENEQLQKELDDRKKQKEESEKLDRTEKERLTAANRISRDLIANLRTELDDQKNQRARDIAEFKSLGITFEKLAADHNKGAEAREKMEKELHEIKMIQQKTPEVECGICLTELAGDPIKCEVCTTQWHRGCIEQWVAKKATCPVCSRSLPSPTHFPPLN